MVAAAHLEGPVDGPAADLLQEIVGGLEAPGPRERRRGLGIVESAPPASERAVRGTQAAQASSPMPLGRARRGAFLYGLSGRSDNEPRPQPRATCVFSEPFVVVVTLAMVTMMLMVNVSCDDTA